MYVCMYTTYIHATPPDENFDIRSIQSLYEHAHHIKIHTYKHTYINTGLGATVPDADFDFDSIGGPCKHAYTHKDTYMHA